MAENLTTAVLLTGAAARISQEVALLDLLMEQKGLVIKQDDCLLTGFSSGSLNLLAVNSCFRDNNPLSWNNYYKKKILFNLKSKDVYKKKFPPFDTTPLRNLLNKFLAKGGFTWCEDLPFRSYVLTFSRMEFDTLWACSRTEMQKYLNLSDLFMSSTAIPVIFPAQHITCKEGEKTDFPGGLYNDGGTGGTFKNFELYLGTYVKENSSFNKLYIISPMRENTEDDSLKLFDAVYKSDKKKDHLKEINLGNISFHTFFKFLVSLDNYNKTNKLADEIYVSIPEMPHNFPILGFNVQEEQYNAVCKWIGENPDKLAVPLDDFISTHADELKK